MWAFFHPNNRPSYLKWAGRRAEEGPRSSYICCLSWCLSHGLRAARDLRCLSCSKGGGERRERGKKGKRGNEDDGTGVEFTLPAGRTRYWCDESPVLLWKSWGKAGDIWSGWRQMGLLKEKKQPLSDFKLFIVPFGMLHKDKTWCLML